MNSFFDSKAYTEADIQSLVTNGAEESINLDFKESGSLDKVDSKKKEITKDVSAFANSDGGIIVYGIVESNHQASSLSFIDGSIFTKEWLEQIINSGIQKRVQGITIYPVRFGGDIKQTVYVVKIPQSYDAPHIAVDKRYYKRFNFQSVQMEEYEIRDLYNRKSRTDLEIRDIIILGDGGSTRARMLKYAEYRLNFQIENVGKSIETIYKLEIRLPRLPVMQALVGNNPIQSYFVRVDGDYAIYSIPNNSPLFQGELTTLGLASVKLTKTTWHLLADIKLKLYFSGGFKEKAFNLLEVLDYQGTLIKDSEWE